MLKLKLLIGLLMIAALLVAMSLFSISLLQEHVAKIDRMLARDFDAMEAVNELQMFSGDLNADYVSALAATGPGYELPSPERLADLRTNYIERLHNLRTSSVNPKQTEDLQKAISEVEKRLSHYFGLFEKLYETDPLSLEDRVDWLNTILDANRELQRSAESLLTFYRNNLETESIDAVTTARESIRFLVVSMIVALILMTFLYIQLWRTVIRPVEELTYSIREVQRRNFERTVPVKTRDEVGRVAQAFNDMAAELRLLKRETDRELLKLNRENRAILEGFPHPTFILDEDGNLSQANPAAEALMKALHSKRRMPLKIDVRYEETRKANENHLPDDLSEAILFRVKEREIWYLPRIFKIGDASNGYSGWAVVLIDVTRFRWLDDMKSDLVGTVSHEIKTPLTSIRMVLHLLAEQKTGELNPTQSRMVGSAHEDCERLLETLENLLQLSRMERGASRMEREPVEPESILENVARSFQPQLNSQQQKLVTDVEESLPRIPVDPHQITQVLNNFLSNAIKHNPPGKDIHLKVRREGTEFLRFSVIDQGDGVPPSEQDRIFERFYRARGEKTKGSGIGLSICREIVHAHEGRIGVNSVNGAPTEFFFDLPLNL
ncbi:MAG: HAMP domain-containing protein [Verrucomicrobiae bacterium]|nr:HAMP domain-containing protein [Verrucomicrobiae bacterium]